MKKIAVLASGGGTNFQAVIDGCKSGEIDGQIVLLIYNRKDAYAKKRADEAGIPSAYINKIACGGNDNMQRLVYEELLSSGAEIVVLAGYLEKLSKQVVEKWENRIINTHPSLIPMFSGEGYYGQNVHKAVIDSGVKTSGCTIHIVDADYDTGPVIMQSEVQVKENDTPETLAERILPHEHACLVKSLFLLCKDKIRVKKDGVQRV